MTVLVLIAQIVLGVYFLMMGSNHFRMRAALAGFAQMRGTPAPNITVPITGLMLLGAGLSFLLGYQVVIGAWLAIIFLVLAAFLVHHPWTDKDSQMKMGQLSDFAKNLALAAALLLVSYLPPETWVISVGR